MNFLRSVFSVGGLTVLSRVTGYFREFLMAQLIGINALSDALTLAIKFPAFFRRLFAEGAFHVSFLPLFTESKKNHHFAGMILTLLILMVGSCVILIEWQFEWLSRYLFGKLANKPEVLSLVARLGRITFPYVFFISLASFFTSILNAYGRFALASSSHAIGNILVIVCVGIWSLGSQDYGSIFAWSILASGIAQLACVVGACWAYGYKIPLRWPTMRPDVRKFLRNFGPGILSVGVVQMNLLVGIRLASGLPAGGISYLNYADRLNQLPLSIIGVSLSAVLLPLLSQQLKDHDLQGANKTQNHAVRFAALISFPACMFLMTLAFPCVSILFGHGKLTGPQITEIAKTLMAYSWGIPAFIMTKVFNTRFFAHGQTRTPLAASALGVGVDIVASILLVGRYEHLGIAFALSLSAWVSVIFLVLMMRKAQVWRFSRPLKRFLRLVCLCCAGVGLVLGAAQAYLPSFVEMGLWRQLGWFGGLGTLAGGLLVLTFGASGAVSRKQIEILWKGWKNG